MTKNFTEVEVLEVIEEQIKSGFEGDISELTHEAFNTDYYIIGTAKAEQALEEYGVFKAIRKVKEYEESNFGEMSTKIEDPEKLANMLFYIIGEETTYSVLSDYSEVNEENKEEILEKIKGLL